MDKFEKFVIWFCIIGMIILALFGNKINVAINANRDTNNDEIKMIRNNLVDRRGGIYIITDNKNRPHKIITRGDDLLDIDAFTYVNDSI